MRAGPRVVIIGAGIVGCALADELTSRGWTDVTVLDTDREPGARGSTGHAPGLVFQTSPSKTMTDFARYTVAKYASLTVHGVPCFRPVGGLELATTAARWADLKRRHGWATSWGVPSALRSPEECAGLHPLIDPDRILGGFHIPGDGLARPVLAAAAQANRAAARGVTGPPPSTCCPRWARPRSPTAPTACSRSPRTATRCWASTRGCGASGPAEAVWITHSAGVAKALAEWLVDGQPGAAGPRRARRVLRCAGTRRGDGGAAVRSRDDPAARLMGAAHGAG